MGRFVDVVRGVAFHKRGTGRGKGGRSLGIYRIKTPVLHLPSMDRVSVQVRRSMEVEKKNIRAFQFHKLLHLGRVMAPREYT